MFCQIHHCYAFEVGCCEPHFYERGNRLFVPDRCCCINDAFEPPSWEEDIGPDCSQKRYRPWVDRYGNRPEFWDREAERYIPVPVSCRS